MQLKLIDDKISKSIIHRFPEYNQKLCMNGIKINNLNSFTATKNITLDSVSTIETEHTYFTLKPFGKKSYIWFSYYESQFLTLLKYADNTLNEFYSLKNDSTNSNDKKDFDNTLYYNNVLLIGYYANDYFILDNVLNYNELNWFIQQPDYPLYFQRKLNLYNTIIHKITNNNIGFNIKLPYITNNYNDIFNNIYNLGYKPYGIYIHHNKKSYLYPLSNSTSSVSVKSNKEEIFKITADMEQDIYNLYSVKHDSKFVGTALIDTYDLSVYMNTYFRNIRENINLDYIEESEPEDDFENDNITKFVNLSKSGLFLCKYNDRFKKWTPKFIMNNSSLQR